MYRLWLDDIRPAPHGWECFTTSQEAIAFLRSVPVSRIERVSLDFDLGDASLGTGYDVLEVLEERIAHEGYAYIPEIFLHTGHREGYAKMDERVRQILARG